MEHLCFDDCVIEHDGFNESDHRSFTKEVRLLREFDAGVVSVSIQQ
jgi:hypothetical protein